MIGELHCLLNWDIAIFFNIQRDRTWWSLPGSMKQRQVREPPPVQQPPVYQLAGECDANGGNGGVLDDDINGGEQSGGKGDGQGGEQGGVELQDVAKFDNDDGDDGALLEDIDFGGGNET
jgi:hypothetical protein